MYTVFLNTVSKNDSQTDSPLPSSPVQKIGAKHLTNILVQNIGTLQTLQKAKLIELFKNDDLHYFNCSKVSGRF